jgi:hypothetical protein
VTLSGILLGIAVGGALGMMAEIIFEDWEAADGSDAHH